jgi:hypothetical protein
MKGSKFYTNRIKVVDSGMWTNFQAKLTTTTTSEKSVQADVPLPQYVK